MRHDPEAVFDAFLRNANGAPQGDEEDEEGEITRNERHPQDRQETVDTVDTVDTVPGVRRNADIVLLTNVKRPSAPPVSVVALRGEETLRLEAELAVPDVEGIAPPPPPVPEGSEDGQVPAGVLDRVVSDMTVLVRYGHHGQVREQLEALTRAYPEDVLLLRRIVEFHVENRDRMGAIDSLFLLAGRLFERRNTVGMRQALEQVLVIEPDNRRAYKLLGLLEKRPITGTGA